MIRFAARTLAVVPTSPTTNAARSALKKRVPCERRRFVGEILSLLVLQTLNGPWS
jgi:hypothetical protein